MKKILLILVLILAVFLGYKLYQKQHSNTELIFYGNVDSRVLNLSFRFLGEIKELLKDEGQSVKKGEILATQDDSYMQNQIKSLKSQISLENIKLEKLQNGFRKEEIDKAKANLDISKINLKKASDIFKRQERLYKTNSTSKENFILAKNEFDTANAGVKLANASYELLKNGSRYEDIKAQKEHINLLKIQLQKAQIDLNNTIIFSPLDGVISKRYKEVGSIASPSESIFEIAKSKDFWVRAYIDESNLGKIKPNQEMRIYTDIKNEPYIGKIGYISSIAEFTPKNIQTQKLRADLVYKFRVNIINPDDKIKQGLPVHLKLKYD